MKALKRFVLVLVLAAVAAGVGFYERPVAYFNGLMYLRAFLTGVESHTIVVAGHRMHYNVKGPAAGQPVVLVHGLGGRAEDWRSLAPYLASAGFRVYMPDLPGYGRSEKPADFSYSVPDETEAVVGFMDALGLKQVDLGGWSMGGAIAQHLAYRHPERVRRLILFDAAGINEQPKFDTRLFAPRTPAELDQLDVLLMPHPPQVPGFIASDILRVVRENGWVIRRALATMVTGRDQTESMLPKFQMPVLVVWGGDDKIFPASQAVRMRQLTPHGELEVFDGCGHLAPGQCADRIGPQVVGFLKR